MEVVMTRANTLGYESWKTIEKKDSAKPGRN